MVLHAISITGTSPRRAVAGASTVPTRPPGSSRRSRTSRWSTATTRTTSIGGNLRVTGLQSCWIGMHPQQRARKHGRLAPTRSPTRTPTRRSRTRSGPGTSPAPATHPGPVRRLGRHPQRRGRERHRRVRVHPAGGRDPGVGQGLTAPARAVARGPVVRGPVARDRRPDAGLAGSWHRLDHPSTKAPRQRGAGGPVGQVRLTTRRTMPIRVSQYWRSHARPRSPTVPPRSQPNSMALYSESLCSGWRASMRRTVPDFDRMTRDWVLAPNSS